LLASLYSCMYFLGLGLVRTPYAMYHISMGQQWDKDAEEWINYDMSVESDILLGISEEKFIAHQKENKEVKKLYSVAEKEKQRAEQGNDGTEGENAKPVPKKNLLDRSFYDALGVEPEATAAEIKRAYYVEARKNHPDRNPDNAEAKANFQKISQAYEVLGDENARYKYDTRGRAAVEGNTGLEPSMLYTLLFGSENFETIIGELYIVTQIKLMTEPTKPVEILRLRQRTRELKLAVMLANKLDGLEEGNEQVFIEKAQAEAKELSESALGGTLLGLIGKIYVERASAQLHTLSAMQLYSKNALTGWLGTFSYISWGFSTMWSGLEMRSLQKDAEARQKVEDLRDGVTEEMRHQRAAKAGPVDLNQLYGPNPTPEQRAKVQNTTKKFSSNL
jgi:hypothetical protein